MSWRIKAAWHLLRGRGVIANVEFVPGENGKQVSFINATHIRKGVIMTNVTVPNNWGTWTE